jgi:hypothetical protein
MGVATRGRFGCLRSLVLTVSTIAVLAVSTFAPVAAGAATPIGSTFAPDPSCAAGITHIQSLSPDSVYAAPTAGVITSWSYQAPAAAVQLKLKVARPAGGTSFTTVGESGVETATQSVVNTFPARISVQPGDLIGLYLATGTYCFDNPVPGYTISYVNGDPPPNTSPSYTGTLVSYKLDVSAVLEPDCDSDGFGDETQDQDILSCPPGPAATITARPKDKTKKKLATFEFSASEPGATFECCVDGGPFSACSSPDTFRVKKGKHHFEVRAKDAGGDVGSAASDDWKVKKKKKH